MAEIVWRPSEAVLERANVEFELLVDRVDTVQVGDQRGQVGAGTPARIELRAAPPLPPVLWVRAKPSLQFWLCA